MKNFWKVFFTFVTGGLILACGFASSPTTEPDRQSIATIVAGTIQAITATAPTNTAAPQGLPVSFANTHLVIPNGLADGVSGTNTTEVELPYINPALGDMPQHIVLELHGYPLSNAAKLMIFHASDYAQYSDLTQKLISALKSFGYSPGQPLPQDFPVGDAFYVQANTVSFQDGQGLRYLTQFDLAVSPINNYELFYYFHGLTKDGKYYVSAILPVNVSFLPANSYSNEPTPPNGVPFDGTNSGTYLQYMPAITQKLNSARPEDFNPPLTTLDALIQSIAVNP